MGKLLDQASLLAFLFLLLWQQDNSTLAVILLLTAVIFAGIQECISNSQISITLDVVLIVLSLFYQPFFYICPFAFYSLEKNLQKWYYLFIIPALLYFHGYSGAFLPSELALIGLLCIVAPYLSRKTEKQITLEHENKAIRDAGMEMNLKLSSQNKAIMEKQDYEIHLATLSERNRIAREIHDNVGHMLSRTILQIGALMVVHKDTPICEQLKSIHATLDQAMTSIRESVHDLHDDSIDLKMSIKECTKDLDTRFKVEMDYDISSNIPRDVKYCMISIVKEALSNALKHSNGNYIHIIVREHPGFYQLSVIDNGTSHKNADLEKLIQKSGIGISNMKDRVEALQGTFRILNESGFQIFVSIPR